MTENQSFRFLQKKDEALGSTGKCVLFYACSYINPSITHRYRTFILPITRVNEGQKFMEPVYIVARSTYYCRVYTDKCEIINRV